MNELQPLTWKEEYALGHELIDEQHRNLFVIVNRLCSVLPKEAFQLELMNLYKHTREHFADEERLMREADYLYYREHREAHDRLLSELNSHVEIVSKDAGQVHLIQEFLLGWAKYHVMEQDRSLASYISSQ